MPQLDRLTSEVRRRKQALGESACEPDQRLRLAWAPSQDCAELRLRTLSRRDRLGGPTRGGAPSTIVNACEADVTLIRQGAVPWDRVLRSLQ